MTSKERARAFLQAHVGQIISMELLGDLTETLESHSNDERQKRQSTARDTLRAVPDLDEEVDDDAAE